MQIEPNKIDWYERLEYFRIVANSQNLSINIDGFSTFPLSEYTFVIVYDSNRRCYWTLALGKVEDFLKAVS